MNELAFVAVGLGGLLCGATAGFVLARRRVREAMGAPEVDGEPCRVPRCTEPARLRGLCRRHYGKAYRLKLLDTLGEQELARLAEDKRRQPKERVPLRVVAAR